MMKMKLFVRNQKGFTLTEMLLALLIIGMVSGLVTEMLGFHISSSTAFSKFNRQQFTVQDAFTRLNRDIEAAVKVSVNDADLVEENKYQKITLYFPDSSCEWNFSADGCLYLNSGKVVEGLADESTFIYGSDYLTVVLMPVPTNTGRHNVNVTKPIVAQYSLIYKK